MDSGRQNLTTSIGLLILRVGVSGFLLTHGWGKVQTVIAGGLDKFADPLGLGSAASLILVTVGEFACALLVVLGLATRFAAAVIVISMGVAAFVVHAADPWTMEQAARLFKEGASKSWASKEPALLYLIPFLALVFSGAGRISIDALFRSRSARDPQEEP